MGSARPGYSAPAFVIGCLLAAPAASQSVDANPNGVDPSSGVEDIVVTAQKRQENVQDIPISILAISSTALEARGTQDIAEVSSFAPNIQFKTTGAVSGSSAAAAVTIRGVGQTDWSLSTEPGVGIYVDGVYMARSIGGVLDALDLERIEILRGPQGTLFGRNTIGGAISLITRQPGDSFEGKLELVAGDRSRLDVRGAVNIPLAETLAARVSFSARNQDGFQRSLVDGRTYGNRNRDTARVQLAFEPSPAVRLNLTADGTRIREDNAPSTLVGVTIDPPGGRLGNPSISFLYNVFGAPDIDVPGFGRNIPYDARWVTGDPDTNFAANGFDAGTNLDIWGLAFTSALDVAPDVELKSITAYREASGGFDSAADGSPLDFTKATTDYRQWQFSQEVQLTGRSFDDRLQWVVGGFFLREKGTENQIVPIAPTVFGTVVSFQDHSTSSIAGFAQGSFRFTDQLGLTAGLRYTRDRKTNLPRNASLTLGTVGALVIFAGAGLNPGDSLPFVPNGVQVAESYSDWSPRFALEYKPSADLLLYGSYSRGFKSGGFNIRYTAPRGSVLGYGPETLASFEAGVKWTGLDRRLRVNASAFHGRWEDLQVVVFESFGAPLIQNAGTAELSGFEVEATAVPVDGLDLALSIGYLDARYTRINNPTTDIPPIQLITLDKKLPNAPEWSLNASASYRIGVGTGGGALVPRVDWSFTSSYENDAQNSEFLSVDSYHLVNLALAYEAPEQRWSLTAFVQNVGNARFITAGNSNYSIGFHEGNFNEPRTWGVRLGARF